MRQPRYSGSFYSAGEQTLRKQIEDCFLGKRGPGALPSGKRTNDKLRAIIAPHAGYAYSGQAAAWSYLKLSEAPRPSVYIILAPSHHSNKSGTTNEAFITPLGEVRVDQELNRKILEKGTIKLNDAIHEQEHSIEVQLPFLQFINQGEEEKIKILPILVSDDLDTKQLALDIKESLLETNKEALLIVSSDFTHHGPAYNHVQFSHDVQKQIIEFDKKAIDFITAQDPKGFIDFINDELASICGALPIKLLLELLKPCKVTLEQYYTSADLFEKKEDKKNSVSYAAIVFEEE